MAYAPTVQATVQFTGGRCKRVWPGDYAAAAFCLTAGRSDISRRTSDVHFPKPSCSLPALSHGTRKQVTVILLTNPVDEPAALAMPGDLGPAAPERRNRLGIAVQEIL